MGSNIPIPQNPSQWTLFCWGVLGGVCGTVLKYSIERLLEKCYNKLNAKEKLLLKHIRQEMGKAVFEKNNYGASTFTNTISSPDNSKYDFKFENTGEVERLAQLGYVELIETVKIEYKNMRIYKFTDKGWYLADRLWKRKLEKDGVL